MSLAVRRIIAALLLLTFHSLCLMPVRAESPSKSQEILNQLERFETQKQRQDFLAKLAEERLTDPALFYHGVFTTGTATAEKLPEAVRYLRGIAPPSEMSGLGKVNLFLGGIGAAMVTWQVLDDLAEGRDGALWYAVQSGGATFTGLLASGVGYFSEGAAAGGATVFGNVLVAAGVLITASQFYVEFTGADRWVWWDAYVRYYTEPKASDGFQANGHLTGRQWLDIFSDKQNWKTRYRQHMNKFWDDEPDVVLEIGRAGTQNATASAPEKRRADYRNRFAAEQIRPRFEEWVKEAREQARIEAQREFKEFLDWTEVVASQSYLPVYAIDEDTRELLDVEVLAYSTRDRKNVAGTDDGRTLPGTFRDDVTAPTRRKVVNLMGIPPWESGVVKVLSPDGYKECNRLFSAVKATKPPETGKAADHHRRKMMERQVELPLKAIPQKVLIEVVEGKNPVPQAKVRAVRSFNRVVPSTAPEDPYWKWNPEEQVETVEGGLTDKDGRCEITLKRVGNYEIVVTPPEPLAEHSERHPITSATETIRVELEPMSDGKIDLTLLDRDTQKAVPGVKVDARSGKLAWSTLSDANGEAGLEELPRDIVALKLTHQDYEPYSLEPSLVQNEVFSKTVELHHTIAVVAVEATDADTGKPISVPLHLSTSYSSTTHPSPAPISVRAGEQDQLKISAEGYHELHKVVPSLQAGEKRSMQVELEPSSARLRVQVKNKFNNKPLDGVRVQASGQEAVTRHGSAELSIPNGDSVALEVSKLYFMSRSGRVPIVDGQATANLLMEPEMVTLVLKVGDGARKPVVGLPGVRAEVVVRDMTLLVREATNKDGELTVRIPAGAEVTVRLFRDGYAPAQATKAILDGAVSLSGVLEPNAQARIAVVLKDGSTNLPLPGATVEVAGSRGTTDSEGAVSLPVPAQQQVTLSVSKSGYKTRSKTSQSPDAGKTVTARWKLDPLQTVADAPAGPTGSYQGWVKDDKKSKPYRGLSLLVKDDKILGRLAVDRDQGTILDWQWEGGFNKRHNTWNGKITGTLLKVHRLQGSFIVNSISPSRLTGKFKVKGVGRSTGYEMTGTFSADRR